MNNIPIDEKKAQKYAFRLRLREVFTDGLLTLVKWNLLFIITSLPVVTAGASLCALYNCTNLLVKDDLVQQNAVKIYMATFKGALKKMLLPGILIIVLNIIFIGGFNIYMQMLGVNVMYAPLVSVSVLGLMALWSVLAHLLPEIFEDTDCENIEVTAAGKSVKELVPVAAAQAVVKLKGTAVAFAVAAGLVVAQALFFPASVPLVLTVGFAIPAQITAFCHTKPDILPYI